MFSGIIEQTGTVLSIAQSEGASRRLRLSVRGWTPPVPPGASVAVSGVCLTTVRHEGDDLDFDVVPETLRRSTLGSVRPGQRVNLERSLRVGDRIEGHFVQGHVDATAPVVRIRAAEDGHELTFRGDPELMRCMIPKGSLAVDGVSLTLANVSGDEFSVALIPTTLRLTTLGALRVGDKVNIETDILVRTTLAAIARLYARSPRIDADSSTEALTLQRLAEAGFA